MKNQPDKLNLARVGPASKRYGVRGHDRAFEQDDMSSRSRAVTRHRTLNPLRPSLRAFSLIEIMLVVALLTLIMVALMSVFSSTQTAFRASITQTDILEGSRAAMDMMTGDFRQMAPSGGSNALLTGVSYPLTALSQSPSQVYPPNAPINFWVSQPMPTVFQPLIGSTIEGGATAERTNQVESVFILTYENQLWRGVGYFVDTNSSAYIDPLYRYDSLNCTNLPARPSPEQIFTNFSFVVGLLSLPNAISNFDASPYGYVNHLMDGVLHLTVRAYDPNGSWITNVNYSAYAVMNTNVANATFYYPVGGEVPLFMSSNTLPASVEIQMAVLEDRTLQRASTFPTPLARSNYLAQQAGKVHLFRQRVTIPNLDTTAYQ